MGVSTLHKIDKVVLPSAVEFTQITSSDMQAGITTLKERPAGHPHPMFIGNQTQEPTYQLTTQQIATLVANVPVGGAAIGNSSYIYYKKATETGSVARATLEHHRLIIAEMVAYWTNITLPHNGTGEGQVMLVPNFDGTNDPIVYAGSVALSGNLTVPELFGAGPVGINGTALPAIKNIDIASGVTLIREGGDSEEFDTFIGIEMTDPIVTVQLMEAVNWATLGLRGTALDGTDGLEFYARKYADKNSRVANATAEHIYCQATDGKVIPVNTSGQGASPITDTFRVECASPDDGTLPLIFTPNTAITAF